MNDRPNQARSAGHAGGSAVRRAYILIVVLGLTAVVTTLGWAFLDANSTVMAEGVNWTAAIRAQYIAESGVALGRHYLMYPPTTVACGSYWTGASNIAVDATTDYTNVSVVQSTSDLNQFTITALGVAHNPDGSISGQRTVTAQVLRPTDGRWHLCQAYLGSADTSLPSSLRVDGSIHINGRLQSYAWCQSAVSATSLISWWGSGPPASQASYTTPILLPTVTTSGYRTYTLNGVPYSAYTFANQDITASDSTSLNAQNWTTSNPGRIIYHLGESRLKASVNLSGTLVVDGNLRIDANNVVITAQPDFPALVVTGYIYYGANNGLATINGSVLCAGGVWDNLKSGVKLNITGTLLTGPGFTTSTLGNQFTVTWDAARSTFWDFEHGTGKREPMTMLKWQDN
jgi:hypothetical protein